MMELLTREISLTEIQLMKLRTKKKAFEERIEKEEGKTVVNALDSDIREQEMLLAELVKRYSEQLVRNVESVANAIDVSFDQTQLARTNKFIDMIDDRTVAVVSEARSPGRIVLLSRAVSSVVDPKQ
jgi:hypothetical protein